MNIEQIKEKFTDIRILFLIIIIIAIFLRMINITSEQLWHDEGGTIYYVNSTWAHLYKNVTTEKNPILYYTLLKLWVSIFGTSVFACRLLSVIFSLLTLPILYLIGKEIKDEKLGLVIMFLYAISPFSIWYANEIRMYSLLHLLFTAVLYFAIRCIKDPTNTKIYIYLSLTSVCLIYTHYIGVVYLTVVGIGILLFNRKSQNFFKNVFISVLIIFLCYLPWIPFAFEDMVGGPTAYTGGSMSLINLLYWAFFLFVAPVSSYIHIPYVFNLIVLAFLINLPLVILSFIAFIGFLYSYKNKDYIGSRPVLNFIILTTVMIFGIQIIIGIVIPDTFQAKNLIGGLTGIHIIEGLGLYYLFFDKKSSFKLGSIKLLKFFNHQTLKKLFTPLLILLLICSVLIFPIYKAVYLQKADWNGVAKTLKKESKSYDLIINSYGSDELPDTLEYYCDLHDFDLEDQRYDLIYEEDDIEDFIRHLRKEGIHRVWVVHYWQNVKDPEEKTDDMLIDEYNFEEIKEYEFRLDISLTVYEVL